MNKQALLSRTSIRPLGHAHQLETGKSQLFEFGVHLVDLPETAVDEQHIWRGYLTGTDALVTPLQRLAQSAIVIPRCDPGDVEAAILLLHGPFRTKHHARGHRAFACRVADVEALQALRRLLQAQQVAEL